MPVAYFDHKWEQIKCCGRTSQTWAVMGGQRLIAIDFGKPSVMFSHLIPNVVLFDLNGVELRRVDSRIGASSLAVSAYGQMVAFTGEDGPMHAPPPASARTERWNKGLLFGPLDSRHFNAIYSLPERINPVATGDKRPETIAWSPDDKEIVYGKDGTILVYNLSERSSRPLGKGSNPLWSPDGLLISYRGPQGEAMLVAPSGQRQQQILRGRKIQHALHWSPDWRYLLLTLLNEDGVVPWARLAIYRLSDGALTSVGDAGLSSLDDSGKEWVLMGPGH
jgi:WD40 repeat protein